MERADDRIVLPHHWSADYADHADGSEAICEIWYLRTFSLLIATSRLVATGCQGDGAPGARARWASSMRPVLALTLLLIRREGRNAGSGGLPRVTPRQPLRLRFRHRRSVWTAPVIAPPLRPIDSHPPRPRRQGRSRVPLIASIDGKLGSVATARTLSRVGLWPAQAIVVALFSSPHPVG